MPGSGVPHIRDAAWRMADTGRERKDEDGVCTERARMARARRLRQLYDTSIGVSEERHSYCRRKVGVSVRKEGPGKAGGRRSVDRTSEGELRYRPVWGEHRRPAVDCIAVSELRTGRGQGKRERSGERTTELRRSAWRRELRRPVWRRELRKPVWRRELRMRVWQREPRIPVWRQGLRRLVWRRAPRT